MSYAARLYASLLEQIPWSYAGAHLDLADAFVVSFFSHVLVYLVMDVLLVYNDCSISMTANIVRIVLAQTILACIKSAN